MSDLAVSSDACYHVYSSIWVFSTRVLMSRWYLAGIKLRFSGLCDASEQEVTKSNIKHGFRNRIVILDFEIIFLTYKKYTTELSFDEYVKTHSFIKNMSIIYLFVNCWYLTYCIVFKSIDWTFYRQVKFLELCFILKLK